MKGPSLPRLLLVLFIAVALPACGAARQPYRLPPSPGAAERNLDAGDRIVIALKSGKRYKGVVVSIDSAMLVTETGRYAWKDIQHISYQKVDVVGTVVGYLLLHALIVGAVYLAADEAFEDD